MGSLRRVLVALAFTPLFGCAAQILQGAQNDCAAFGFRPGTDAFADCVQRQFGARQANVSQTLSNVGSQMAAPPSSNSSNSGATAYLRSQSVSGTSRICVYNRMGNPFILTVGAAEICPITQ